MPERTGKCSRAATRPMSTTTRGIIPNSQARTQAVDGRRCENAAASCEGRQKSCCWHLLLSDSPLDRSGFRWKRRLIIACDDQFGP